MCCFGWVTETMGFIVQIYGNWIYNVVLQMLLPIWLCLWTITFGLDAAEESSSLLETTTTEPKVNRKISSNSAKQKKPVKRVD